MKPLQSSASCDVDWVLFLEDKTLNGRHLDRVFFFCAIWVRKASRWLNFLRSGCIFFERSPETGKPGLKLPLSWSWEPHAILCTLTFWEEDDSVEELTEGDIAVPVWINEAEEMFHEVGACLWADSFRKLLLRRKMSHVLIRSAVL